MICGECYTFYREIHNAEYFYHRPSLKWVYAHCKVVEDEHRTWRNMLINNGEMIKITEREAEILRLEYLL